MSTLLKATVAVGLVLLLIGTAHAVVLDPSPLIPPGSPRTDIGTPGDPAIPGYAQPFVGAILVAGGGSNIGGTDDHGFFLYEELAGDGSISAVVQSFFTGSSPSKMAGVMIRDSLDANSANAANFALPSNPFPVYDIAKAQARTVAGGTTDTISPAVGDLPGLGDFIRVTRAGDVFTFAWSPTGLPGTWVDYSSPVTVRMTGTIYVGLAVTSSNNLETASARIRNTTITGFGPAAWLTWDELGDDTWNSASWLGGPPSSPDNTTFVLVDSTNTDRITITADAQSLDLTVKGGTLAIGTGRTLKVFGAVDFQTNAYLEMANGSKLITNAGGTIENLVNIVGDSTIDILGDMQIKNFGANLFGPGTLTKLGLGTLQLDNASGVVIAPNTTFKVSKGMLASKGVDPFGGADAVILEGTTLRLQNAGAISTAATLNLPASSKLIVNDAPTANLGALTFGAGGVQLTTEGTGGAALFASTNFAPGVGAATFNTSMNTGTGPVNLGADLVTITKTGTAKLIVSGVGTNLANATFAVNQGALVGVAGSNPFGAAKFTLGGGELVLANNGLDNPALFDNAVTVAASSTLTGGKGGLTVGGPPNVRLGSALNGLTVNSGQTLTVQSTDSYALDIAGALAGTGTMTMSAGTVGLSGGGTLGRLNANGGTMNTTAPLTISDVRPAGGTLNIGAALTTGRFRVTSGVANASADLNVNVGGVGRLEMVGGTLNATGLVNATTLTATGGTMNSSGVLNAGSIMASAGTLNLTGTANAAGAVLSGSALVNANQLVLSNSLRTNDILYSVNTGTVTAKGSNLLAGVGLSFGGNTLTVRNTNGLLGLWTFNDETANDSSGSQHNGTLVGGSYSTDVPAVLGGKSVNLTGGDNYVYVNTNNGPFPDPYQNVFNVDKMTLSAWVKGWPDGSWEPFISKRGETNGYQLRRYSGEADNVSFTLRGAGDDYQGADKNINDGQWHQIVATYDGANQTIYIDGVVNATRARTGAVNDTVAKLVFGARQDSETVGSTSYTAFARVQMDDIYVYNRALSQAEINTLYANTMALKPALNLPNSNFTATDNATLAVDTTQTALLGNLTVAGGKTLNLVTGATQPISFGDLTAGDGSSIVGNLLVRDEVSVGSSPGVLDVVGNLTLAGTSVYAWDLDSMASDLINVSGKLTLKDGWTLKVVTSEPFVYGQHLLFTYGTSVLPSIPDYDLSEAPGWRAAALDLSVDMDGNVFLIVPEPATLAMLLLAAGVAGLFYARRRRQAA